MKKTFNTSTFGKVTFEKVGENWFCGISKHHSIVVVPTGSGWVAKEQSEPQSGSFVEGTKAITTIKKSTGKTIKEALANI